MGKKGDQGKALRAASRGFSAKSVADIKGPARRRPSVQGRIEKSKKKEVRNETLVGSETASGAASRMHALAMVTLSHCSLYA